MPQAKEHRTPALLAFINAHFDWFLSVFIIALGIGLLYAASRIHGENVWHEIVRDIGIASLIAAIVSLTYETFARSRFLRHTMEAMLSEIFGNIVHPDVWRVVKDEVIRHEIMRECLDIHFGLQPLAGGSVPGQMVLWMRIAYDLKGLHDSPRMKPLPVRHFLDDRVVVGEYPRFNYITVNGQQQPLAGVRGGVFETLVKLPHRHHDAVKIASKREEVTYLPGSYYLTMTELTKGIKLHLTELPEGVEAFVSIRPYKENVSVVKNEPLDDLFANTILLPGHSIEFRFKLKAELAGEASPDAGRAL